MPLRLQPVPPDRSRSMHFHVATLAEPPWRHLLYILEHMPHLAFIGTTFYVQRRADKIFTLYRWDSMQVQVVGVTGPVPGVHAFPHITRVGFGFTRVGAIYRMTHSPALPFPPGVAVSDS